MEDQKNLLLAIVLTGVVLIGWQYLFAVPQMEKQKQLAQQQQTQTQSQTQQPAPGAQPGAPPQVAPGAAPQAPQAPGAPSAAPTQSREAALAASPRIRIDTPRLSGSLALMGGRIDDLALVQYRETVDPSSPPIVLLAPSGSPQPFYAEFGWTGAAGTTAKLPGPDTLWRQEGSGALAVDHPVTLVYDNGEGLVFRRNIGVDDKYLFTVKDDVANNSAAAVTLYPYALVSRHGTPAPGYGVSHEGPIGVMGDSCLRQGGFGIYTECQEESYKTLEEKKVLNFDVVNAWFGFADKYWAATLLPATDAKLHAKFSSGQIGPLKTYQADYLLDPQTVAPGGTGTAEARLFAGAKEVATVNALRFRAASQPFRAADRLGAFLLHHPADVLGDRPHLPLRGQFRRRDPDHHGHHQGNLLPARQQVLRLDGQDEGGAAGDDRHPHPLRRRQGEAAAGHDGAVQARQDQSGRRLPADRHPDPGVLLALQGAVRHHRDAARAVLRLDQGSRPAPIRPTCSICSGSIPYDPTLLPVVGSLPASGRLAADHGRHHVPADEAQSAAAGPGPAGDLQLDAGHLHLHAGEFLGRPGDLLGLEQFALGRPAERDHEQARRQDRAVRQHQGAVPAQAATAAAGQQEAALDGKKPSRK